MVAPIHLLLLSGKRKCGKDFLAEKLLERLGDTECCIVRISEPIKRHYAQNNNLDLKELLSDGAYKEMYRKAMIEWSDSVRLKDPGYFCQAACKNATLKSSWIVSDIRRKTDIKWFMEQYGAKIQVVRITCTDDVRKSRGWSFTKGVDDVMSECDLDNYAEWDLEVSNNNATETDFALEKLLNILKS